MILWSKSFCQTRAY